MFYLKLLIFTWCVLSHALVHLIADSVPCLFELQRPPRVLFWHCEYDPSESYQMICFLLLFSFEKIHG